MNNKISKLSAIGRRKTSTATVSLVPRLNTSKESKFEVNGRLGEEYFQYNYTYLKNINRPLRILELENDYKIFAKVSGGGLTGQADAIKLALSRILCDLDKKTFRPLLKPTGLLSRDARIKERKKYGLKKARKASQYSKR
ncbi:unnamed protein product [Chrysoparadoxa australica]